MRPRILLLLGDTAGVGPELCAKVASDIPPEASGVQVVITGDIRVFKQAQTWAGMQVDLPRVNTLEDLEGRNEPVIFWDRPCEDPEKIPRREVSKAAGKEVLDLIMLSIGLAKKGLIDGFVFAPFNKESMHLAGADHYSELELFKAEFGRPDIPGEFNLLDDLWLARVTSHVPVSGIVSGLSIEKITHTIELLAEAQEKAGISPKIAVSALNPHAGEHGMFGDEEGRLIQPAIDAARKIDPSWEIQGPMPADTLFPRVLKGEFTGVVGMYHDQLQIASKLLGLERGVTFHPGMKVPIATAAHGTAFDIQGTGKANHQALRNALALVAGMAVAGDAE